MQEIEIIVSLLTFGSLALTISKIYYKGELPCLNQPATLIDSACAIWTS